jgi:hypothetical protein
VCAGAGEGEAGADEDGGRVREGHGEEVVHDAVDGERTAGGVV